MIGTTIGNYRIVRELGVGGMGAVYEGTDIMVERPVAIKVLRAEIARQPELIERFRVEAVTLARLNHPCIATLYSFFREGENFYMVMEFVRGNTLENLIARSGRLTPEHTAEILLQTLDGMAHAHDMGVLHRDLKPANIMIATEGRVKVTDFGIARVLGSSRMTREGRIIGTLEYLAPERIRGEEADIRSDLYSVGIVMYESVTGRLPFTADTDYDLMQAHLNQAPPPLRAHGLSCPPWVETILHRALAKSREERFQSAGEFRDALAAVVQHPSIQAGTAVAAHPPGLKPTRLAVPPTAQSETPAISSIPSRIASLKRLPLKPIGIAAGALVLLLGLLAVIYHYFPPRTEPQQAAVSPPAATPEVQPPTSAEIKKPESPDVTASAIPLETFQNQLPVKKPGEPIASIPKEIGIKGGAPKTNEPPGTISKPVAPPSHEEPKPSPPPADTVVKGPAQPAEPIPANGAPVKAPAHASTGVKTLREIRKIYVDKIPDQLDEYIKSELARQLGARVTVVSRKEDADAILQGETENRLDKRTKMTGGYLGLRDENVGSASLTEIKGAQVLWKSAAGDKSPILGIVKRGGFKKVAERLVSNLKYAIENPPEE